MRPLEVDDSGVLDPGKWEAEASTTWTRMPDAHIIEAPMAVLVGLPYQLQLQVETGYQTFKARGEGGWDEGMLDTGIELKWGFWADEDSGWSLAAALQVTAPTAPKRLETAAVDTNLGGLLVATKSFGATELDLNFAYNAENAFTGGEHEGGFFYGIATRHNIVKSLWLVGEVFAESPHNDADATVVNVGAGTIVEINDHIAWDMLAGTGFGSDSREVVVTTGFTFAF